MLLALNREILRLRHARRKTVYLGYGETIETDFRTLPLNSGQIHQSLSDETPC